MGAQNRLNSSRCDILTAPDYNILSTPGNIKKTVVIKKTDIAGIDPSSTVNYVVLKLTPVAIHRRRGAHEYVALNILTVAFNAYLDNWYRATDGARMFTYRTTHTGAHDTSSFGEAVGPAETTGCLWQSASDAGEQLIVYRRPTEDHSAQGR
jgi:hypothetical protein